MTIAEERDLRIESAAIGAEMALRKLGLIRDEISQREAFREFGQSKVRTWANTGLITRVKVANRNGKVTYSRIELETIRTLEGKRLFK